MTKNKFYITTPIYYTNSKIHIGGAYTTIAADVLARWNRLNGKSVFFLTGTDEHGQKIQEVAEQSGKKPKEFVDEIAKGFKEAFKLLNISNDYFIRTTDKGHEEEVKNILQELYDKEYIYKGSYEAYYCVGCEQYKTESEIIDEKCPLHNRPVELRKEESYLFKLSKFQDKLLKEIKSGRFCILPEARKKEVISFIESGLKDISISRLKERVYWGIPLPFDKNHTCFVWVDAFWNYITGLKENKVFEKFWPVDIQLMAKDIIRVHGTIWPALLLATGNKLPKTIFVHGYFTINGQKMSKSLGNVISPTYLVDKYGTDSLRYFLMRNIPFGEDGDFSENALIERNNNELANKLGNLISRVSTLAESYGLKKKAGIQLSSKALIKSISKYFESLELDKALNEIFAFVDKCNEYIQKNKPWETHDAEILYETANAIKDFTILLSPFMPETSEKISRIFNFEISLKSLKSPLNISKIKKSDVLFRKIDSTIDIGKLGEEKQKNNKVNKSSKIPGIMTTIDFKDWQKIDLRVGKIEKVEEIKDADKLYKLTISIGKENRTVCAGLKKYYSKSELLNKKCVVFLNLAPRTMKGQISEGMLLAAVNDNESQVILISPEKDIEVGSKIR